MPPNPDSELILRIVPLVILAMCVLLLSSFVSAPQPASAQPNPTTAWNQLINAFRITQQADSLGPSRVEMANFTNELNTALAYYEMANVLANQGNMIGAEAFSNMSYQLSSNVAAQATNLRGNIESQITVKQVIAYSVAVGASFVSALLLVESHRIRTILRKFRTRQQNTR
jgi:hypothetical protein